MIDKEIRELEQGIKSGDKNAYPLLAIIYERTDDLPKAINILKYYFKYLNKEPNSTEEQIVALNNYFRVLLDFVNKQNDCNLDLKQLAWFALGFEDSLNKPYQLAKFFNIRAYTKKEFTSAIAAFHSNGFHDLYQFVTIGIDSVKQDPKRFTVGIVGIVGTYDYDYNPKFSKGGNWPEINNYIGVVEGIPYQQEPSTMEQTKISLRDYTELWAEKDIFDRITVPQKILTIWAKNFNISKSEMKTLKLTTGVYTEGLWL